MTPQERAAWLVDFLPERTPDEQGVKRVIIDLMAEAVAAERGRCARLAERLAADERDWHAIDALRDCAAAIREGREP